MREGHISEGIKFESERQAHSRLWHGARVALAALVLLAPARSLAQEIEGHERPRLERVYEDRDTFLERLSTHAQQEENETAWDHATRGNEAFSLHVEEYSTPTSVFSAFEESDALLLEGYAVEHCHTHPPSTEQHAREAGPTPSSIPSPQDVESYLYGMNSVLFQQADVRGSTEEDLFDVAGRFTHCVVTPDRGYWTMRAEDITRMAIAADDISAEREAYIRTFTDFLDRTLRSQRMRVFFSEAILEKEHGYYTWTSIASVVGTVAQRTTANTLPPELKSFADELFSLARPALREEASQISVLRNLAQDTFREGDAGVAAMEAYIAHVREHFGIHIEWSDLPQEEHAN